MRKLEIALPNKDHFDGTCLVELNWFGADQHDRGIMPALVLSMFPQNPAEGFVRLPEEFMIETDETRIYFYFKQDCVPTVHAIMKLEDHPMFIFHKREQ